MDEAGLRLGLVLALLRAKASGLAEDLAFLALTLAVYDSAMNQGLLDRDETGRSVPVACGLVQALSWQTSAYSVMKGHCQAERFGFYVRLAGQRRLRGNLRLWRARPLTVAGRTFQREDAPWQANHQARLRIAPQTCLRGVGDLRVLTLRTLFSLHAKADGDLGRAAWQISQRALAELLGISKRSVPDYVARAGLICLRMGDPYAPLPENQYVLSEHARLFGGHLIASVSLKA